VRDEPHHLVVAIWRLHSEPYELAQRERLPRHDKNSSVRDILRIEVFLSRRILDKYGESDFYTRIAAVFSAHETIVLRETSCYAATHGGQSPITNNCVRLTQIWHSSKSDGLQKGCDESFD
jgi:hypothetical protein